MKTKSWAVPVGCVVGAIALVAVGIWFSRPKRPASSLAAVYAMAAREGHVPKVSGYLTHEAVARLADGSPSFTEWLLGLVKDETADSDVRMHAFGLLMSLQDSAAKGRVLSQLVAWVWTGEPKGREATLRLEISAHIPTQVLLTELPDAEALRLIQQARPRDWHQCLEGHASRKPNARGALLPEYQSRATARARPLLAQADSALHTRLMALVQAEAPLPEGMEVKLEDLPRLAEGDPAFRKWLAGVVASVDEGYWVRALAFKALLDMERDEAVRDLMADFHTWFRDRDAELDFVGRDLQEQVGDLMVERLLLTDLPLEEVLQIVRRSLPLWDTRAMGLAKGDVGNRTPWSLEQQERLRVRGMQLAECVGGDFLRRVQDELAAQERLKAARKSLP